LQAENHQSQAKVFGGPIGLLRESHCCPLDFFGFSSTLCRPLRSPGCNLDLVIVSTEAVDSAGVLPLGSLTFYISVLNQPSPNACLLFRLQVKHFTNVCSPGRFDQILVIMFLGRGNKSYDLRMHATWLSVPNALGC
jgi:hypothetical protein